MSQKQNKNQAKNTCIYFANGLRPDKLIAYKKIFAATKSLQIEHRQYSCRNLVVRVTRDFQNKCSRQKSITGFELVAMNEWVQFEEIRILYNATTE